MVPFSALAANAPLPMTKPSTPHGATTPTPQNFNAILEQASKPMTTAQPSIITPPPMPYRKQTIKTETVQMINGIPVPTGKPLKVRTAAGWQDAPRPDDENRVVIRYHDSPADRMAGGGSYRSQVTRTHAQKRERLRETDDRSPFKTAKLPRARAESQFDPIIIFFEENSSELEVGQIEIIKKDVVERLRKTPSSRVAVYGYSERDRRNPDRTQKLSLSRALLISEYLADNRITPARIEARAMGNDTPISPKNRVDIVIY